MGVVVKWVKIILNLIKFMQLIFLFLFLFIFNISFLQNLYHSFYLSIIILAYLLLFNYSKKCFIHPDEIGCL